MKAEDIYNKALTEYPIREKLNEKAVGTYDANYPRRKAFVAGAEWMQDEMIENPDGGALLYAVVKTAERTKREMIEKAEKWLSNNMFNSINNGVIINGYCVSDFIGRFKKAMQDERDFRAIDNAYSALDDCISKIVKSRLDKDRESEERALYKLEIETNGVLQDLSYIKQQLQKKDWIKVEDRLPERIEGLYITNTVLVRQNGNLCEFAFYSYKEGCNCWYNTMGWRLKNVTHWQEIVPSKDNEVWD